VAFGRLQDRSWRNKFESSAVYRCTALKLKDYMPIHDEATENNPKCYTAVQ